MTPEKDIETREDIRYLVGVFYDLIKLDETLGPIFNRFIKEDEWDEHLEKLTDFWLSQLFGIPAFNGNPVKAHRNVDKELNHSIDQTHFAKWLNLWFSTVNSLYKGEVAEHAKNRARNMATGQFLRIWEARPENQK